MLSLSPSKTNDMQKCFLRTYIQLYCYTTVSNLIAAKQAYSNTAPCNTRRCRAATASSDVHSAKQFNGALVLPHHHSMQHAQTLARIRGNGNGDDVAAQCVHTHAEARAPARFTRPCLRERRITLCNVLRVKLKNACDAALSASVAAADAPTTTTSSQWNWSAAKNRVFCNVVPHEIKVLPLAIAGASSENAYPFFLSTIMLSSL